MRSFAAILLLDSPAAISLSTSRSRFDSRIRLLPRTISVATRASRNESPRATAAMLYNLARVLAQRALHLAWQRAQEGPTV